MTGNLFLDLETYNEQDISVGTYRYAETADVLLFAYAFGDGPVEVWDRTREPFPPRLYDWLTDDSVSLTAHNSLFDRNILTHALDIPTRIERWRCTMAKAYSHAFPGSLGACGAALGLPKNKAKLVDGKKLINRFCKPAPGNHKADRYDRTTHPDEWARFIRYAAMDIEAMREVDKRLPSWNWKNSDIALYHLDQRINDRGFRVDRELTEAGAKAAVADKERMAAEFIQITNGIVERPTQRDRFRDYLNDVFALGLDNTRAETFRELLAGDRALDPDCRRLMEISILSNKTSTAKYATLAPAVSSDGRFRGGLQFRGAARTRRWCLTGDHEVLTEQGWIRLDQWTGGRIVQYAPSTRTVSWHSSEKVSFDYDGELIVVDHAGRICAAMTPEHSIFAATGAVDAANAEGRTVAGVPRGGHFGNPRHIRDATALPATRTRLIVAANHDGHTTRSGAIVWQFIKGRKIKRLEQQLRTLGIRYSKTSSAPKPGTRFYVAASDAPVWLRKETFGPWLLAEGHDPRIFVRELIHWNGHQPRDDCFEVCAKNRVDAEWMVTMAHLAGYSGALHYRVNAQDRGYWYAAIHLAGNDTTIKPGHWSRIHYRGEVFCPITKTGTFLVRYKDTIHVTGNSGRNFQPQNLPSRGLPPQYSIDLYIRALKADMHEVLFDDLMLYGSAALRGVVIAPDAHELAVADLSNIEGRILAWLAGETWKIKAFFDYDEGNGPDLYNITATSILGGDPYKVPKSTRNVFGKVPDLAFGYEGGFGACQTFAKAYGVSFFDHWGTITQNVDPKLIASAKANYTTWGEERNPDADKNEWVASDVVKLAWRARHPKSVQLWKACKEAAKLAIQNPGKTYRAGPWLRFAVKRHAGNTYLLCRLPSGNFLCYFAPRYHDDGAITYMGIDSTATGGPFGKWQRLYTYGGKIVENACQSFAYDIMTANMPEIDRSGFPIILTVHDEILAEPANGKAAPELASLMSKTPDWLPDFPLAAAGFECTRYRKDA